jgi:hypothetical protein
VRLVVLAPSGTPEDIIAALRHRVFFCQCAPFDPKEIARYVVSAVEAGKSSLGIEVLSADREWITVRMNSDLLNADRLTAFFRQFQLTMPERPPEEMMTAFQEILHNAIGFHQHRARRGRIPYRRHLSDAALLAHINRRNLTLTEWERRDRG